MNKIRKNQEDDDQDLEQQLAQALIELGQGCERISERIITAVFGDKD